MKAIEKIIPEEDKFRALDEMLNRYYSHLDLQCNSISFILDGKLYQAKLRTRLKRAAGKVN